MKSINNYNNFKKQNKILLLIFNVYMNFKNIKKNLLTKKSFYSIITNVITNAALAHLVEQLTCNQ